MGYLPLVVPDLCFSEMPPVDRNPTVEIGVYRDNQGNSTKRGKGKMPSITQPRNLLGRLPSTDVLNVYSTSSSINLDSLGYVSEVGPYDSISQASLVPSLSIRQPNISNERSALSNFGDETRPHSVVSSNRLSIYEDGVQSTARASANRVVSTGTMQQTTTAIQDNSESDVANAAVTRTAISDIQQTDAVTENEVSYSKQQQLSYEKEPSNIASNDALSQLEQLLRRCDWSRTTLASHMNNDFELPRTQELSSILSRISRAATQPSAAKVNRYDRMDNLDHVVVHTESEYQSRQTAATENATFHITSWGATDDHLIDFDNQPRVLRSRAHCDDWHEHRHYIYDHAGNISTSVGYQPRILMYQSHDDMNVNDFYNACNTSSQQGQYIGDQEKVSEPESDLPMGILISENLWNVSSEYSDRNKGSLDDGTTNTEYREYTRSTRVHLEEQYGGGDVYPYQTILRGSNMAPRNFWRPHRLN